jgi:uncharacterized membrane protein
MKIPGMVFCRFCGKEIHESAPACPQCGGIQDLEKPVPAKANQSGLWIAITALTCGIIGAMAIMDDKIPDRDTTIGIAMFGLIGIVFGSVSISNQLGGTKMSIAAVILSVISLLALIGMHTG